MREILVVDLDNTLLKSDMLLENFWSAFSRDWRSPFRSLCALMRGTEALRRYLAGAAQVDVTSLPYDKAVISYIEAWRGSGGRTALVTATDDAIARSIGAHLNIFDEVHGSNGSEHLKGQRKARFLIDTYGEGEFAYMGDSKADLAVWTHANHAVTVNASDAVKKQAAQVAAAVEHLETRQSKISDYLKAIRPHQWMKNALVFLPMLAAHQLNAVTLMASLLAFVAFSLFASSVYVVNDLLDLNADRAHPRKRDRPFAAGRIPIASGTWIAAGLLLAGAAISAFLGPLFFMVMLAYFMLSTGYSLHLKRRIIIDIFVLAGLYTARIVAGGVATGLLPSPWLLAFSIFFFLSLAAVKRQAELVDAAKQGLLKSTGRGYHIADLPIIAMISLSAGYSAVLVLALYVNSPKVAQLYDRPEAMWGICAILLYWITRTVLLTHRGAMHDDPLIYAAGDRISQICFVFIAAFALAGALL